MNTENKIPRHVAIIMDGNGRWAEQRGLNRSQGHLHGVQAVREAIKGSLEHKVSFLTLYVFSMENWGRPSDEVNALMDLLAQCVEEESAELIEQGVKIRIIGESENLSDEISERLKWVEQATEEGKNLTVVLALNYGSRFEIAAAARNLARSAVAGKINPEQITTELFAKNLYTDGCPDPDLVIRTGGDLRLSNFLLWQSAYSELYFTPEYWPDFDAGSFSEALNTYAARERRYGLVSNQPQSEQNEK